MFWIIGSMTLVLFWTVLMCILIVGGRADDRVISVSALCKNEGISPVLYYSWVKDSGGAGRVCLKGDSLPNATQSGVQQLEGENIVLNFGCVDVTN